jgi:hypothetical protein
VVNELANFASREKGLYGNLLPYQNKIHRDSSSIAIGNQFLNLNLNLPGAHIRPGSHHQTRVENDDSSRESSKRDAASSISNPNIMWSSNGIGFDFSTDSSGLSAKSSAQTAF